MLLILLAAVPLLRILRLFVARAKANLEQARGFPFFFFIKKASAPFCHAVKRHNIQDADTVPFGAVERTHKLGI